jgi:hypothetical protein
MGDYLHPPAAREHDRAIAAMRPGRATHQSSLALHALQLVRSRRKLAPADSNESARLPHPRMTSHIARHTNSRMKSVRSETVTSAGRVAAIPPLQQLAQLAQVIPVGPAADPDGQLVNPGVGERVRVLRD